MLCISSNAGTVEQMLYIIAKIAPKKLCTDCRFYHNEETDTRYHTVVSFHEENRGEENKADDVNVMATNDIWDESDNSYPNSRE